MAKNILNALSRLFGGKEKAIEVATTVPVTSTPVQDAWINKAWADPKEELDLKGNVVEVVASFGTLDPFAPVQLVTARGKNCVEHGVTRNGQSYVTVKTFDGSEAFSIEDIDAVTGQFSGVPMYPAAGMTVTYNLFSNEFADHNEEAFEKLYDLVEDKLKLGTQTVKTKDGNEFMSNVYRFSNLICLFQSKKGKRTDKQDNNTVTAAVVILIDYVEKDTTKAMEERGTVSTTVAPRRVRADSPKALVEELKVDTSKMGGEESPI